MTTTTLKLTDLEVLGQAAECLRTLGHPHRLRMVQMLLQGEFTVSELADACGLPSAMASEHLRLMQPLRLFDQRQGWKEGVLSHRRASSEGYSEVHRRSLWCLGH